MKLTRLVSSTKLSEKDFWSRSLLGRSLLLFPEELRPELWIRFENEGKWGLPEIYNRAIEACPPDKHLLFVHDDVFLHDVFLQHRVAEALGRADVVGLAGSRGSDPLQPSWGLAFDAELKPVGWQTAGPLSQAARSEGRAPPGVVLSGAVSHVSRYVDPAVQRSLSPSPVLSLYGNFPAECDLLDGLFLACNTALLQEWGVRFDERLRFHLYDLDFCRTAKKKNLRLSTWPILVSHGSGGNFDTEEFRAAARQYLEKWSAEDERHSDVPLLVECSRCGAVLLPGNAVNHGSWHRSQDEIALEELQRSDEQQAVSSKQQAPDPDPKSLKLAAYSLKPSATSETPCAAELAP